MIVVNQLISLFVVTLTICSLSLAQSSSPAPGASRSTAPPPVIQPPQRNLGQMPTGHPPGFHHNRSLESHTGRHNLPNAQVGAPARFHGNPASHTNAVQGAPGGNTTPVRHRGAAQGVITTRTTPPPASPITVTQNSAPTSAARVGSQQPGGSGPGFNVQLPVNHKPLPKNMGIPNQPVSPGVSQDTMNKLTAPTGPAQALKPGVSADTMNKLTAPNPRNSVNPAVMPTQPPSITKKPIPPTGVEPPSSSQTTGLKFQSSGPGGATSGVNAQNQVTAPGANPPTTSQNVTQAIQGLQGTDLTRYNNFLKAGHAPEQALGFVKIFRDLDSSQSSSSASTTPPTAPVSTPPPAPVQAAPAPTPAPAPVQTATAPAPVSPQTKTTVMMTGAGTELKMHKVGTDKYTFEVVGSNKGDRFLDGVKKDGSDIGLGTQGGNGTVWKVHDEKGGKVRLECVNCSGNDRYLDGSRSASPDQLGLAIKSNSGTLWKINKHSNGTVTLECAEKNSGPKLLSLKTETINPPPTAPVSTPPASVATPVAAVSAPTVASNPASTPFTVSTPSSQVSQNKNVVQMSGSGTQFKMTKVGTDKYTFEVVGSNAGDKFLDGVKKDGTDVGLGTKGGNGTVWKVHEEKGGKVRLECLSCSGNDKYLDGSRSSGSDQLGLAIKSNSGTLWKINKNSNGTVTLECAEKDSGPKLLSLKTDIPNAPVSSAPVASNTSESNKSGSTKTDTSKKTDSKSATNSSDQKKSTSAKNADTGSDVVMGSVGTQFILHDKGNDTYSIEVAGVNKSAKYLDGSKSEGDAVGLGISGNKGTLWKAEKDKDGNTRFKCVDCTGSKVYLDGIQSGNATEVGLGIKGNTGTEWKMVAQPDGKIALQSADAISGAKFLTLLVDGKNASPSVPYETKKASTPKGVSSSTASGFEARVSSQKDIDIVNAVQSSKGTMTKTPIINNKTSQIKVVDHAPTSAANGSKEVKIRVSSAKTMENMINVKDKIPTSVEFIEVLDNPNLSMRTITTDKKYTLSYMDRSLDDFVKKISDDNMLQKAYESALNIVGKTPLAGGSDQKPINIIFTKSKFMTNQFADGMQIIGTNDIIISLADCDLGNKNDLNKIFTRIAHETTHQLFDERVITPFLNRCDKTRYDNDALYKASVDKELNRLYTLGESLAYYSDYREFDRSSLSREKMDFLENTLKGLFNSKSYIDPTEANKIYMAENPKNDDLVKARNVQVMLGLSLGGPETGYDKHQNIHDLVSFLETGDSVDNATRKIFKTDFDTTISNKYSEFFKLMIQ